MKLAAVLAIVTLAMGAKAHPRPNCPTATSTTVTKVKATEYAPTITVPVATKTNRHCTTTVGGGVYTKSVLKGDYKTVKETDTVTLDSTVTKVYEPAVTKTVWEKEVVYTCKDKKHYKRFATAAADAQPTGAAPQEQLTNAERLRRGLPVNSPVKRTFWAWPPTDNEYEGDSECGHYVDSVWHWNSQAPSWWNDSHHHNGGGSGDATTTATAGPSCLPTTTTVTKTKTVGTVTSTPTKTWGVETVSDCKNTATAYTSTVTAPYYLWTQTKTIHKTEYAETITKHITPTEKVKSTWTTTAYTAYCTPSTKW